VTGVAAGVITGVTAGATTGVATGVATGAASLAWGFGGGAFFEEIHPEEALRLSEERQ